MLPSLYPPPGDPGSPQKTAVKGKKQKQKLYLFEKNNYCSFSDLQCFAVNNIHSGVLTYANIGEPLPSMFRSPRRLKQPEWTTDNHENSCS